MNVQYICAKESKGRKSKMHDIKRIREHPDAFDAALAKRGLEPQSKTLLALDEDRRAMIAEIQELETKRNMVAKEIPTKKKAGEDVALLIEEGNQIKARIAELKDTSENHNALHDALARIPNLLADDVPEGADESGNKEISQHGEKPNVASPKDHVALGEALGMMDFETAATMSGSRFVILSGQLARLERALGQFMLDMHTNKFGYTETNPPYLVRDNALFGTGQLPKFAEDLFAATTGHWLIPTSEVALTNIVADKIIEESSLPRRYTALTPCFRSEAGSAGRDTRGMIRQHQFSKVELVGITKPEDSEAEHERMLGCAEAVLKALGLHYRVMLLCAGDNGFSARKTYDIEVWLPSQNTYREISSISNCGDFQARRMKARFKREGEKKAEFVHTLNGSGLAVGRTLIAVMENYQQPDGSIRVPEALKPYMGGLEVIGG
jgi:seryl-tRNA synthetase